MEKVALLSLASDLKRIVQAIQRNSSSNATRFNFEAKKWLKKSKKTQDRSIIKLLGKVAKVLDDKNNLKKAENCLMYSVLIQNRVISSK